MIERGRIRGNPKAEYREDERRSPYGARRAAQWLAPGLCVMASVLCLWLSGWIIEGHDASSSSSREQDAMLTEPRAEAGGGAKEPSGQVEALEAASDAGGNASTDTFLLVLEQEAVFRDEVSCSWSSEQPIDELARSVLLAYRDLPHVQLATSGYLDLKGNAWGAIVFDPDGWVDIVTVAEEGDESSCARVVRMVAAKDGAANAGE